jgi:hypothetical protein
MKLDKFLLQLIVLLLPGLSSMAYVGKYHSACVILANSDSLVTVPIGGNTWRTGTDHTGGSVTNDGITDWTNQDIKFTTYIRFANKGKLKLWLTLKVADGKSRIAVSALNTSKKVLVTGNAPKDYYVGEWDIADSGYIAFQIKGLSKTGISYADISSLKLTGSAINERIAFVKNNEGEFFYWGRRGPSVHLGYITPDNMNAEWFYNEVSVTKGNDVVGSYFMADGFAEGYFGMQVNSPTERHILFSVWSPFKTDNPGQVPENQKIIMLKKGPDVHTGEFGSEGSGGQSYLQYNWKAGNTYKFLIHAKPDATNHTIYTAYFFAPEVNKWQLIASFSRPQTNTYLKHLHSFLENFEPEQGNITRQVFFTNQWIAGADGKWTELNKARFTIDNTGIKGYRVDYAGGTLGNSFYLKNCGFFNDFTLRNTLFTRSSAVKIPDVNLDRLP